MNVVFRDPPGRDFLIVPRHEQKAFSADIMRRIGECAFLKNWIFRDSGIYIQKAEDGIVHAVKIVSSWNRGTLHIDVVLCVFLDRVERVIYDGTKDSRVFCKKYHSLTVPLNLIELERLAGLLKISDGKFYTFLYIGDEIDIVDRIKYELDNVSNIFFDNKKSINELISVFEKNIKNKDDGIFPGYEFDLATLYYISGRKSECRGFMKSWGDSSKLKKMMVDFREFLMRKLESEVTGP